MSKAVTLAAALPDPSKTDVNGLGELATKLVQRPKDRQVIVALVDCDQIVTTTDSGLRTPRVRICEVEAVLDPDEAELLRNLLVKIRDRRLKPSRPKDRPEPLFQGTGADLRRPATLTDEVAF